MNELKVFENEEFGTIRTEIKNGEPWFCLLDLCKALDLDQPSRVKSRLKADWVTTSKVTDNLGREREAIFVNEANLYKVILQSRKQAAERFSDWLTSEVLPSIRKNGGYINGQTEMTPEQIMANALMLAQNILKERDEKIRLQNEEIIEQSKLIETMQPKVNYVDEILKSNNTVLVTQIAQDYGMSAATFNKKLHTLGVQRKVGDQWILYTSHQGNGYVHSVTIPYKRHDGSEGARMQTEWTQKGRLFLYELLKENGILPQIEQ